MRRSIKCSSLLCGPLAQLVEQLTLNQRVAGSSPARPTIRFQFNILPFAGDCKTGHLITFANNSAARWFNGTRRPSDLGCAYVVSNVVTLEWPKSSATIFAE